jgi:dipeptidyl aminopeptidase/acylaminoacyl peptidase
VATASRDGSARVWNAQTGLPVTELLKHEKSVEFVRFSPDGGLAITASDDNAARLWDPQTGQPLTEPLQHGGKVYTAQFSPDGRRVVTASRDGTARIWDVGLAPSKCPEWLLQLAEALAGKVLDKQGFLEPTRLDRPATIERIRELLKKQPDTADGVLWGRWLLADRASRTLSPFSSIPVPK